jgi:hypothetical protein
MNSKRPVVPVQFVIWFEHDEWGARTGPAAARRYRLLSAYGESPQEALNELLSVCAAVDEIEAEWQAQERRKTMIRTKLALMERADPDAHLTFVRRWADILYVLDHCPDDLDPDGLLLENILEMGADLDEALFRLDVGVERD